MFKPQTYIQRRKVLAEKTGSGLILLLGQLSQGWPFYFMFRKRASFCACATPTARQVLQWRSQCRGKSARRQMPNP